MSTTVVVILVLAAIVAIAFIGIYQYRSRKAYSGRDADYFNGNISTTKVYDPYTDPASYAVQTAFLTGEPVIIDNRDPDFVDDEFPTPNTFIINDTVTNVPVDEVVEDCGPDEVVTEYPSDNVNVCEPESATDDVADYSEPTPETVPDSVPDQVIDPGTTFEPQTYDYGQTPESTHIDSSISYDPSPSASYDSSPSYSSDYSSSSYDSGSSYDSSSSSSSFD